MGVPKWEIRLSLLLLLCTDVLAQTATTASAPAPDAGGGGGGGGGGGDVDCSKEGEAKGTCSKGHIKKKDFGTKACSSIMCINEGGESPFKAMIADLTKLTPNITVASGFYPMRGKQTSDVKCLAWDASADKKLQDVEFSVIPEAESLPTTGERQDVILYGAGVPDTVITILTLAMFQLTEQRHNQTVRCAMVFDATSVATDEEKAKMNDMRLYFFEQSDPYIKGPTFVEIGEAGTWTCTLDYATYDEEPGQLKVDFKTMPLLPSGLEKKRTAVLLNAGQVPPRRKVEVTLTVTVPASLSPAFFLQCTAANYAMGTKVETYAPAFKVKAETKPHNLDTMFNIIGTIFGLGGFVLGMGLFIFYYRKKKQEGIQGGANTGAAG